MGGASTFIVEVLFFILKKWDKVETILGFKRLLLG
jgi:hypothetical protein